MNLETESRIAILRRIAVERDLTPEENREAITLLRQGRLSAHHASAASRKKSSPKMDLPSADDLLDMMGD